jgi:anti-sigma regulatory factor (Ser/Thr protein kinase)
MDEELAWSREARWSAHPRHVADARCFVADCLTETGLMAHAQAVTLVVSELVTNVVIHAGTPFTVLLARRDHWLVVEVRDHGAGRVVPPEQGPSEDIDVSGRGLGIVRALSEAWGVWPRRDGKSVWAAFRLASQEDDLVGEAVATRADVSTLVGHPAPRS